MTPILATKLYLPRPQPHIVSRPRLIERLNEGSHHKLTLISAPAGFGKTTLISEWVEGNGLPTAWLSLDEGESDFNQFLTYLVAALQTIAPNIGEEALRALQSSPPPPTEAILTGLLNEITLHRNNFVLVLDDYHVIDAKSVDLALTYLVEHLPPQMRLVIATREDPHLPMARLRAESQLTELRAADLRFTASEAAAFLNQGMGLTLSTQDIAALEGRTEGWIAGLQLAALSVKGRQDVSGFIQAFTGDHRYIMDYLVEEVLQRQPDTVRSFLLQTSILDQMNGSLCDAVTGQEKGAERLEALERGNFFVAPLDDKRHWYRYHHLFAEFLSAHLMAEQPDQVATLHRRASVWYEQNGLASDAIRHALAAKDFERAASLIELAVPEMRRSRQEGTLLGWLRALPDELINVRPVLSVGYAWALLAGGELAAAQARLLDAERWLDTTVDASELPQAQSAGMVVVDEEEFRRLPGAIAIYRAALAQALGDVSATVKYAQRALDFLPEDEHLGRGAAEGLLGLAFWASGDLESARQTYADSITRMQRAGHLSDVLGGAIALANIQIAQGHLYQAMSTYERTLRMATEHCEPVLRGTADLYVGISELHREHGHLHAAMQSLLSSKELGAGAELPQNQYRWRVAMARIHEAQGDLDEAISLLDEAERVYVGDFFPNVRPIAALKAHMCVKQGKLGAALGWAREQNLSVEDDVSYLREFEHITLARVLLARYKIDHAGRSIRGVTRLLDRLLHSAEDGGRVGSIIEILVLQALAHDAQGDITAALMALQQALTLAEPEDYVRMFVDEGQPMATLLEKAAKHGIAANYVRRLLTAFGEAEEQAPAKQALIDPLSERELGVLRLLGTDLSGPEIARELIVSLNTLRTHTKSIYNKLGVNSRRAAVRRAEELDLL